MKKKGLLIVLSGPSGVGKGTVREHLFNTNTFDNLRYSISMTTREPRAGEINGVHYYFVSKNEFLLRIEEGKMLEWAEFVGNYYGTPLDYVEKTRNEGYHVFLEIEVQGAMQVKEKVNDALMIFLAPPSIDELRNRILGRGTESIEVANARLKKAEAEIDKSDEYDYVVVNNQVEEAALSIVDIINKESH